MQHSWTLCLQDQRPVTIDFESSRSQTHLWLWPDSILHNSFFLGDRTRWRAKHALGSVTIQHKATNARPNVP